MERTSGSPLTHRAEEKHTSREVRLQESSYPLGKMMIGSRQATALWCSAATMATDGIEAFSPPSLPISGIGPLETLVDLLDVAGRRPSLPMIVCRSSRDELDAVCSAVSNLQYISLASLSSDLAEVDRALILEKFRQTRSRWSQKFSSISDDKCEVEKDGEKSHMIVVTDACLPLLAAGESPLSAHVLINYELPTKKETYLRRMTTPSASDGILINMVVGGEVVTLKSIEESSGLVIAEMPINMDPRVGDI